MQIWQELRWSTPKQVAEILETISKEDIENIFCRTQRKKFKCDERCENIGNCIYDITGTEIYEWLLRQDINILERGFLHEQKH